MTADAPTLSSLHLPGKADHTLFCLTSALPDTVGIALCVLDNLAMPQHPLTDEQSEVVRSSATRLAVVAGAGTGKTHTLAALASSRPHERILYATFSKAAQLDASARLPPNVQARTLSSLAYATHGRRFRSSGKLSAAVRPASVAHLFPSPSPQHSLLRARFAIDSVHRFCQSTDTSPEPSPDAALAARKAGVPLDLLEADTHTLWARMSDPSDPSVPASHDVYFKAWAIDGAPGLSAMADRFLVDEAQDNSPVADALFASLPKPVVYVGDPSQSIYAFRGAVDTLSSFAAHSTLSLSISFRFGPAIAALANALLSSFKTNPLRMTGASVADAISDVQADLPFTVVTRTNAGVFSHALVAIDAGHPIELVGGYDSYSFGRLIDLHNLAVGRLSAVSDPLLRALASLDAVEAYAKLAADHELKVSMKVVRQYGHDIPHLVSRIRSACDSHQASCSKPLVTICTTHKSKGLEFPQVVMGSDFPTIYLPDGSLVPTARTDQQEINLLYVALTRASTILQPTPSLRRLGASSSRINPHDLHHPCAAIASSHLEGSTRLRAENTRV